MRSRPAGTVSYLSWFKGSYWSNVSLFGSFRARSRHSLPPFPHAQTEGHGTQWGEQGCGRQAASGLESGSPGHTARKWQPRDGNSLALSPDPNATPPCLLLAETGTLGFLSCSPAPSTGGLALGAWHTERAGGKDEQKDGGWVGTGQMGGWHRVETWE